MTPRIVVVSGDSGIGKTTVCTQVAVLAKVRGLAVAGILSPSRWVAERRMGIDVEDIRSGQKRPLAKARAEPGRGETNGPATVGWRFDRQSLEWGAAVLRTATPCDLLIVDEIGPLELLRGEGWIEAMSVLRANDYRLAVVVVRPALVTLFLKSLDGREPLLLSITSFNRDALPGQVLALLESDE